MVPLQAIRRSVTILTAGLLSILLIMWFATPYKTLILGLILGISTSLYNVLHLSIKLRIVSEQIIKSKQRPRQGIGMINRFLMVTLAMIITLLFPQQIDYRTVILGLPFCYVLNVVCYFWQAKKLKNKGGESREWS